MKPWQTQPSIAVDRNHLQECSEGDRVFEQELLHLFVDDTHQHMIRLKTAISTQEFEIARREAHHIKGASAHVGAVTMFAIAAELEAQMKHVHQNQPCPLLHQLEAAYQAVITQTAQWDQELASLS